MIFPLNSQTNFETNTLYLNPMSKQLTSHILMIRPANFNYNELTAESNAFQEATEANTPAALTQSKALFEFDQMVEALKQEGVDVIVIDDNTEATRPDAVFPNNWISFHDNGHVVVYPMMAPNRRPERRMEIIEQLKERFEVKEVIDLSHYEEKDLFLESTGSMIFDRANQIVYACYSPRTSKEVLEDFAKKLEVELVQFTAKDEEGQEIYHTNVMMSIGEEFAVVCLDAIPDEKEREALQVSLEKTGKEIISIQFEQMKNFAGNVLEIENKAGEKLLVMSEKAYQTLGTVQITDLEKYVKIVHTPLDTIEANGGGSARCMMAEVFLPEKQ